MTRGLHCHWHSCWGSRVLGASLRWKLFLTYVRKTIAPKPLGTTTTSECTGATQSLRAIPLANNLALLIRALESRVAKNRALLRVVGYFICLRFRPYIPSCARTALYMRDMDDSNSQTFACGYFSYLQIIKCKFASVNFEPWHYNNCFTHRISARTLLR